MKILIKNCGELLILQIAMTSISILHDDMLTFRICIMSDKEHSGEDKLSMQPSHNRKPKDPGTFIGILQ